MKLLKFEKFKLLELHQTKNVLAQNKVYTLLIIDEGGKNTIEAKLISYGWSLHREIIYYEFKITDSYYDKYSKGGLMILGLDFNDKENTFYFYPYHEDISHKADETNHQIYKAKIKILF